MTTYQDAHPLYRRLGWTGPLPLPAGAKLPPPSGFTGWDGIYPSFADCLEFDELPAYRGTIQTALRMRSTVAGLDVDAYDDRTGAATIAEAVRRWGPLPAGPWSSARDDGMSGIRFFQIPDGTVLVSNIAFPELKIGHVEVIQRHHRYAAVWPSIHPSTGALYTWRGTASPDCPPAVDRLPVLPEAWLIGLAGTGRAGERARPEQVAAFVAQLPAGVACAAMRAALHDAEASLRASARSRHDDTCAAVLGLLRLGERGHPGAIAAIAALRSVFVRAVTADGSRTDKSAESEFDRMEDGERGVGLLLGNPTPAHQRGCRCGVLPPTPTSHVLTGILRTVLNASSADQPQLLRWAVRKFRGYAESGQLDTQHAARLAEQLTSAVSASTGAQR